MLRHRGKYDPLHSSPYELSRSRVENFVRCPACFYMQQVEGIKFPDIPGFNINEATDVLLKKHFDKYRADASIPPFFKTHGLEYLVPFQHENFDKWTQSLHFGAEGRMHTVVEELNLKIGGGLDDVWQNTETKELHIVDYKSTSQKSPGRTITLDDPYKAAYKRQMDLYVWVLRRMGFDVSDTGYFLYVDGDRFTDRDFLNAEEALMVFKTTLIPYTVDVSWIAPTLKKIKSSLDGGTRPEHSDGCQYGAFLNASLYSVARSETAMQKTFDTTYGADAGDSRS